MWTVMYLWQKDMCHFKRGKGVW